MTRLLPYPLLALSLLVTWILLNGWSPGHLVLGCVIALAATGAMVSLQPAKPTLRRWSRIPWLVLVVLYDIALSNLAVASLILRGGDRNRAAGFVEIPLQLRDPTGLAVLACIITSTPGTAWVEYHSAGGLLRIHVLDLVSAEETSAQIKQRYESLLLEIFE